MTDCLDHLPAAIAVVASKVRADTWCAALSPPMRSAGIITPLRVAAFLGQAAEESAGFMALEENLNYSAERLCAVWPSRFPTVEDAAPYAHNPEALANHIYSDRMGNGDEASGDGWRFHGRGLLQLTGRSMTTQLALAVNMNVPSVLPWLVTPIGAATSACWFWNARHLNALADAWNLTALTRAINGGDTNLASRVAFSDAALRVLGGPINAVANTVPAAHLESEADALNDAELKAVTGESA